MDEYDNKNNDVENDNDNNINDNIQIYPTEEHEADYEC